MNGLDRYRLSPFDTLWTRGHQHRVWAAVAARQAIVRFGDEAVPILNYSVPPLPEVLEAEKTTRHDVAAFLKTWRARMRPEHAKLVHIGLTSSDLVDTGNSVVMAEASHHILLATAKLTRAVAQFARKWWLLPRLGRTHGQPAEATTLGFQFARHAIALMSNYTSLDLATNEISQAKMSGPTGGFRFTTVEQEQALAKRLGEDFHAVEVAGQRAPREGYARWVSELALLATSIEDLLLQIRLGQQFGIQELVERFSRGQVGSSSMPHKQNPIACETLTGLARIVRAQVIPVTEGIPTWNERDITHSSVERMALDTASTLTYFMVVQATEVMQTLYVDTERVDRNLMAAGTRVNSAAWKVQLVESGMPPEEADQVVAEAIRNYGLDLTVEMKQPPPMNVDHVLEMMEDICAATEE